MSPAQLLRKRGVLILLLAAAALLIYGQSLKNEFVIWDDDSLVYLNPLTQEMTLKNVWGAFSSYDPELYVPLTIVSFQIEHALVGFNPFFFHLDNLLLHIVAAALVLMLLERLGLERRTAFVGALLFAIHPINAEAVAWVSARKDVLAAVFSLAALLLYLHPLSRARHGSAPLTTGAAPLRWVMLLFFLMALLSKPVAIVLPAAFLLIDWLKDGNMKRTCRSDVLVAGALSVIFLIIGLYGKQQNIGALSLMQTLLLAIKSTVFSLQTFFWPADLSSIYLQTDPISITLMQFWGPLVLLLIIAIVVLVLLMKKGASSRAPTIFGVGWYVLFLLPSFSNFVKDDIYYFSDRYIYLSQIGMIFLLGYGWERLLMKKRPAMNAVIGVFLMAVFGTLAWSAHAQSLLWHDSETLYHDALGKNDRSVVMHYNLAVLEHRRGNRSEALAQYQKALAIDPRYAKALSNLGILYNEEGKTDKALEQLHLAIQADSDLPDPHNTIGSMLMDLGNVDGAIAEFRNAIAVRETFAQAHINLGAALGRKELYEDALREYKRAFELAPQLLDGLPEIRKALDLTP